MSPNMGKDEDEHPSVTLFRDYLRIKTVQPDPDYEASNKFLTEIAKDMGIPSRIIELSPGIPVVVMTWEGLEPDLPSILLNSHTDVVPVYIDHWKWDPFEAIKDEKGDVYARGTQDMKSVGIQHLEAIRRLKSECKRLKRTIHLSFIGDEEAGGYKGMAKFVLSQEFKKLNIGLALDEGLASPNDEIPLYYGERNVFWTKFHCRGNPGHGSRFIEGTAAEKVQFIINKMMNFRAEQKEKLESNDKLTLGDVTTVNLTFMSGGVAMNVVPNELTVGFDVRITPQTGVAKMKSTFQQWIEEAGGGIETEFLSKYVEEKLTSVAEDDPWYKAFKVATDKHNLTIKPRIFPAATDSRFLREVGIPAFGFSPMNNTPVLLHDHNEFLNEKIFLKGIDIFYDIIFQLANL